MGNIWSINGLVFKGKSETGNHGDLPWTIYGALLSMFPSTFMSWPVGHFELRLNCGKLMVLKYRSCFEWEPGLGQAWKAIPGFSWTFSPHQNQMGIRSPRFIQACYLRYNWSSILILHWRIQTFPRRLKYGLVWQYATSKFDADHFPRTIPLGFIFSDT